MANDNSKACLAVIDEEDLSPALDQSIRDLLVCCFPADRDYYTQRSWWHCIPAYRVIGIDVKGSIVAHAAVVQRSVSVGPTPSAVSVAGIQSFCVSPVYRKTGMSDRMMAVAMEQARTRGLDAGLLFCQSRLEAVYKRMGWDKLGAAVYMYDEKRGRMPIPAKNLTMFFPLKVRQFPLGDIDLTGPDW